MVEQVNDGIGSFADEGGLNLPISKYYFLYTKDKLISSCLFEYVILDFDSINIFLEDTWVFWYDDTPMKGIHSENDINVKVLGEFSTIQDFWGIWRHLNTLELLPEYSNIRLFRKGVLPVWEDPANTNGGKWILPTHTKEEAVRLWPLLVLMCIGEQFESEIDVTGVVLSLTPAFSHPPSPSTHAPTFQVWARSGTGPLSLLSSPSLSSSSGPISIPSSFTQKLFINNHNAIVFQPHLFSVEYMRTVVKPRESKPKKKRGKDREREKQGHMRMDSTDSTHSQKSEYEDDESEDSRATTPAEDYHFIPIEYILTKLDTPGTRPVSPFHHSPSPSVHNSGVYHPPQLRHSPPPYSLSSSSSSSSLSSSLSSFSSSLTHSGSAYPVSLRISPNTNAYHPSPSSPTYAHYANPSPPPFSNSTPTSPVKSQTPPPFSPQRSVSARTLNEPTSGPQSPPRGFSKLARSASPQSFQSLHNFHSGHQNHATHSHSHEGEHSHDHSHGPSSRGPTPTNSTKVPSRASSTSPSFFNRRVQQTKKDELMKKISHSKQAPQIEPHEIKHNPLLLQLVSFTKKHRAAGAITPTPTRSASPQATPPTSPKISAPPSTSPKVFSSSSSAFAIKKSQEIPPPLDPHDGSPSAFGKKEGVEELVLDGSAPSATRKEVEKLMLGSKLKHSIRVSQNDTAQEKEVTEEEEDVGIKPKRSLKFVSEMERPPLIPDPTNISSDNSSPEILPETRDREDSISSELMPGRLHGFGNENGEDDKFSSIHELGSGSTSYENKEQTGIKRRHNSENNNKSHSPQPQPQASSSPLISFDSPQTNSPTKITATTTTNKDPLQTMYNSKYTSYGTEVEQNNTKTQQNNNSITRNTNERQTTQRQRVPRGAQDTLRRWWLLFCILFVLCIARWLV